MLLYFAKIKTSNKYKRGVKMKKILVISSVLAIILFFSTSFTANAGSNGDMGGFIFGTIFKGIEKGADAMSKKEKERTEKMINDMSPRERFAYSSKTNLKVDIQFLEPIKDLITSKGYKIEVLNGLANGSPCIIGLFHPKVDSSNIELKYSFRTEDAKELSEFRSALSAGNEEQNELFKRTYLKDLKLDIGDIVS
jgi:hypothetical protein